MLFIFISFWKQTFFLNELMSCFVEGTGRAPLSIAGESKGLNLSDGTRNLLNATIDFLFKFIISKGISLTV